ncbi:jg20753 [Pararge aegeria aegeria]|uniref:Jg20753 protein n=1 Tax=Pararge aegeria aegeria TaxID=348720 RepID=A0A8S4R046_9NEOP|nr:jg20753 [Pararge aegeria aegeria]
MRCTTTGQQVVGSNSAEQFELIKISLLGRARVPHAPHPPRAATDDNASEPTDTFSIRLSSPLTSNLRNGLRANNQIKPESHLAGEAKNDVITRWAAVGPRNSVFMARNLMAPSHGPDHVTSLHTRSDRGIIAGCPARRLDAGAPHHSIIVIGRRSAQQALSLLLALVSSAALVLFSVCSSLSYSHFQARF